MATSTRSRTSAPLFLAVCLAGGCRHVDMSDCCSKPCKAEAKSCNACTTAAKTVQTVTKCAPTCKPEAKAAPCCEQVTPAIRVGKKSARPLLPPQAVEVATPKAPPTDAKIAAVPPPPKPAFNPHFNHAPDYSFLTGQLSYSPHKKQWRLRFAPIDVEDRFGGSVTLNVGSEMKDFTDGQFVQVRGSLIDRDSIAASPPYRVSVITGMKK